MPKTKSQSKKNTALWKKVSKAMQDFYRLQGFLCYGHSKSCTVYAQVVHHHFHWGSCKELRLERMNLVPLCQNCHASIHNGHQETGYSIRKFMEADYGTDWEDRLMAMRLEAPYMTPKQEEEYLKHQLTLYT